MEIVAPLISFNWTLVMVVITFLVLYLIVKKFFFEKVRNFMLAREQAVKDQFDSAEAAERLAGENLAKYEAKLEGVKDERRAALKEAREIADRRAEQIINEAHARAEQIIKETEAKVEQERAQFSESMRDQIAMLAVYMAEKIIEKQLDESDHIALIDDIIEKKAVRYELRDSQ